MGIPLKCSQCSSKANRTFGANSDSKNPQTFRNYRNPHPPPRLLHHHHQRILAHTSGRGRAARDDQSTAVSPPRVRSASDARAEYFATTAPNPFVDRAGCAARASARDRRDRSALSRRPVGRVNPCAASERNLRRLSHARKRHHRCHRAMQSSGMLSRGNV